MTHNHPHIARKILLLVDDIPMRKDFKAKRCILSNTAYLYLSIPADRSHRIVVSS
jgi:hypothetical protein